MYETEALLDHLFFHPNTAPFIAHRLIQRMTTSNPSPTYVKAVSTAFSTGACLHFISEFVNGRMLLFSFYRNIHVSMRIKTCWTSS